jgi:hypothetical protein
MYFRRWNHEYSRGVEIALTKRLHFSFIWVKKEFPGW